ncbi:MAG: YdcF family protein [Limnohabitans sp.]
MACGTLTRMDALGILKPLLTTLLLPPGGLLLMLMLALTEARKHAKFAWSLVITASALLWLLSCHAISHGLGRWLLPTYPAVTASDLKPAQAIVVLGGGVNLYAPEYGEPTMGTYSLARLQYGAFLKRQTGLPMLFAGGKGWRASSAQMSSEAEVAATVLHRDTGMQIEWLDKTSRDTHENALKAFEILAPLHKTTVLLVTNDWHMARSVKQFEKAGFTVIPAPMGFVQPPQNPLFDYLPSAHVLGQTQLLLKEWLGLLLT